MENTYQSKYTEKKISPAAYLAEFVCERIAHKEKETLPRYFWNTDKWKKIFKQQIVHASQLLQEHNIIDIMTALRGKRGWNVYSLGVKKRIEDLIKDTTIKIKPISHSINQEGWDLEYEDPYEKDEEIFIKDGRKARSVWEKLNG